MKEGNLLIETSHGEVELEPDAFEAHVREDGRLDLTIYPDKVPVESREIVRRGMALAASEGEKFILLEVGGEISPGAPIS